MLALEMDVHSGAFIGVEPGQTRRDIDELELAGLHDMVDVQRAVGVVGCSLEAGVGAVQVSECGQKQGGLN